MDKSTFPDEEKRPGDDDLRIALGKMYNVWVHLSGYTFGLFPGCREEWNYSKAGWNMRIKDKKRAIIYLMPCTGFFKASFVLGEKAANEVWKSAISEEIKEVIRSAPVYGEGRGFRIEVKNKKSVRDIEMLLQIKKMY